jgi:cytochrome P450
VVASFAPLLLTAGFDTTSNTIGLGAVALLENSAQFGALCDDPSVALSWRQRPRADSGDLQHLPLRSTGRSVASGSVGVMFIRRVNRRPPSPGAGRPANPRRTHGRRKGHRPEAALSKESP